MTKIIYHNDLDGRCAGFIAAKKLGIKDKKDLFEIAYGRPFPFDKIEKGEKVLILDYHIPTDEMSLLRHITTDIIWVDHHITALQRYEKYPIEIAGLRDLNYSGCVNTYMYLYSCEYEDVPYFIQLIGDRDTWTWQYGKDTLYYCSGAELYNLHPLSYDWRMATDVESTWEEGKIVEKYKAQRNKEYIHEFGYITEIDGHKAIAVNKGKAGSEVFDSCKNDYPVQILWVFDGDSYKVSLRSKEVDVSKIALNHGGGGHVGASGFECNELPFKPFGRYIEAIK